MSLGECNLHLSKLLKLPNDRPSVSTLALSRSKHTGILRTQVRTYTDSEPPKMGQRRPNVSEAGWMSTTWGCPPQETILPHRTLRQAFPYDKRKKPEAKEDGLDNCFHLYKIPMWENRLPWALGKALRKHKACWNCNGSLFAQSEHCLQRAYWFVMITTLHSCQLICWFQMGVQQCMCMGRH